MCFDFRSAFSAGIAFTSQDILINENKYFHMRLYCGLIELNAPINVNPEGGGGGRARGGDLTFLQKKMSNATPSGENSWAKFPTPGMKLYS